MANINRKDFLKKTGIALISGPFILRALQASGQESLVKLVQSEFDCVLQPYNTGGPFYLDPEFNRSDMRDGLPGIPMLLRVRVMGVDNCQPIPNAIVNVWHCDHRGVYSQFGAVSGNLADASDDFFYRAYQATDEDGYCEFTTNFPGWYPGRATHIHFDAHIGFSQGTTINNFADASSTFVSQMYPVDSIMNKVYSELVPYTERGINPTGLDDDFILAGSSDLIMSIDEGNYPESLTADFTIGLDMAGTPVGIANLEGKEHFELGANFPNPFKQSTKLPFSVAQKGTILLSVFNTEGELVEQLVNRELTPGDYEIEFNRNRSRGALSAGEYLFEMQFQNAKGRFKQTRLVQIF